LVFCLAAFSASIGAHHNPAMLYDLSKEIEVQGVVTEYRLGNPHLRIYFDVDAAGQTEQWMAEGGSRTVLLRKGWDANVVSPGDRVTFRGHATRDGSNVIHMVYLILPDGTELFGEDLDRGQYEDIRRRRN
jgi:phenylpropionate dioxygenase-like ring-hydroxylating dioxygenase large terminal subunit